MVPRAPAGIAAVSCVAFTKVVTCCPLKETVEPDVKFVPFTVSVNAPLFTKAEVGEIDETVGRGLSGPAGIATKSDTVLF